MSEFITPATALVGVALAILAFWRDFTDHRARRYSERFKTLLEMSDVITDRGQYAGLNAVDSAAQAHTRMLDSFDREARANAVMYVRTAGRLNRPGSMPFALGLGAYGVFLVWFVLSDTALASAPASDAATVSRFAVQLSLLGVGLLFFGRAVYEGIRRWSTRGIRIAVGHDDELTLDWWRRVREGIRRNRDGAPEVNGALSSTAPEV